MKKQECPKGEKLVDLHVKIPSGLMKKLTKGARKEEETLAKFVVDVLNGYFFPWFKDVKAKERIEWKDPDFDFSLPPKE